MREALPPYPYFVFVGRCRGAAGDAGSGRSGLDSRCRAVPVPLLPGDADVPLDLEQALTAVYDTFRYDRTIDSAGRRRCRCGRRSARVGGGPAASLAGFPPAAVSKSK